jgi:hypothetical protein
MKRFLAFAALALVLSAQEHSGWRFIPVNTSEDGVTLSGLVFSFEEPCANTATVTAEGRNGNAPLKVTGEVSTDQHGDRVLRFPIENLATLKITKLTLVCGRFTVSVTDPVPAHLYELCGGKK